MNDEIGLIILLPFPFDENEKIFNRWDEDREIIGEWVDELDESYSYNDFMQEIMDISGLNKDLMGSNDNI